MSRLRRSDWRQPGITRRRQGRGFTFRDADGSAVRDPEQVERIRALAIPPAWTDVWICPYANGHLQAVGTDDAGRRQYLYHPKWRQRRDLQKHVMVQELGEALPGLRTRCRRLLRSPGLNRERVLAAAIRLLDLGLFRIGTERYTARNQSYGLATLERSHVAVQESTVTFDFPAKSGQRRYSTISEPAVCQVIEELVRRDDTSTELLGWRDESTGTWCDVKSTHINAFLQDLTIPGITAKDFRTWHGSVLMAMHLSELEGERLTGRRLTALYRLVAEELGNTASVARSSYVDPRVVDLAEQGHVITKVRRQRHELVPIAASRALVDLLGAQT